MEIYYVKFSKFILYFFISQISLFFVDQGRINIMLNNYFPILLFIIVSIIIGALPIIASRIINKGCINFHPSLPKYRGVCGCSLALYYNDEYFGVTCHYINENIETLRDKIASESLHNKEMTMKYINNLTKLSKLYI